jgi:hypothetical protein
MKTVNLNKILIEKTGNSFDANVIINDSHSQILKQIILAAMKDACNQTVDLCQEIFELNTRQEGSNEIATWISEDSILKTKEQIIKS